MPVFKTQILKSAKLGIWKLTETIDDLEDQALNLLTTEEKNKYEKFKSQQRRKEWLATRILTHKLNQSTFFPVIVYDEACKPRLADQNIGISHSRNFVAVILSDAKNVAIDIEKISEKPKKIRHKFLSQSEIEKFDTESEKICTLLWSAKETVYKYYGKKELPFIGGIEIMSIDEKAKKMTALLKKSTRLTVNFDYVEDNVLTFIE